ncbi:MAG TPA: hypothetical protein VIZ22_10565 [Candidatus Limnocylindrales bacterium]
MIRNLLSGIASGLLVWAYLLIWDATDFTTPFTAYFFAGVVAALGGWIWPVVIGWFLVRRHRSKQDEQIQKEVDRQIAEKSGQ